jgi:hypothetical protein
VPDVVGKDDPVAIDVERLSRAEQFIGKVGLQELLTASTGAVQDHDRIVDLAACVALRPTQGGVVDAEGREPPAALQTEVADSEICVASWPLGAGSGCRERRSGCRR